MSEKPLSTPESTFSDKQPFNSNKIKDATKFIEDNTTKLVLIPTFIGGIIQLFNLYMINPYLIRFFSITQLISDGLWVLLIFIPLYFLVPLAILFLSPIEHKIFRGNDEDKKGITAINFMFVLAFILFPYFIITNKMYWLLWVLIASSLMGVGTNKEALKVFENKKKYENWITFYNITSILTTIIFIYTQTLNNTMPKNIGNLKVVETKIQQSFPNYKHTLLYLNDKYLFSKVYCDSINEINAKIIILKIDDLFSWEKKG